MKPLGVVGVDDGAIVMSRRARVVLLLAKGVSGVDVAEKTGYTSVQVSRIPLRFLGFDVASAKTVSMGLRSGLVPEDHPRSALARPHRSFWGRDTSPPPLPRVAVLPRRSTGAKILDPRTLLSP